MRLACGDSENHALVRTGFSHLSPAISFLKNTENSAKQFPFSKDTSKIKIVEKVKILREYLGEIRLSTFFILHQTLLCIREVVRKFTYKVVYKESVSGPVPRKQAVTVGGDEVDCTYSQATRALSGTVREA